jgi:hypothetical protein
MSELNDVKNNPGTSIILMGKERILRFGMRAISRIEEKIGDIDNLGDLMSKHPGKNIPLVIFCMLAPGNDDITEENIADALDEQYNFTTLKLLISDIMKASLPKESASEEGTATPTDAEK